MEWKDDRFNHRDALHRLLIGSNQCKMIYKINPPFSLPFLPPFLIRGSTFPCPPPPRPQSEQGSVDLWWPSRTWRLVLFAIFYSGAADFHRGNWERRQIIPRREKYATATGHQSQFIDPRLFLLLLLLLLLLSILPSSVD